MLYIIDGTGPYSHDKYAEEMKNGFCQWIFRHYGEENAIYQEGPGAVGFTTGGIAEKMLDKIISNHEKNPLSEIVLIGHSRGGAACIYIAHRLKEKRRDIKVQKMLLFDAVNKDLSTWVFGTYATIPDNVEETLHFVRSEEFSNYFMEMAMKPYPYPSLHHVFIFEMLELHTELRLASRFEVSLKREAHKLLHGFLQKFGLSELIDNILEPKITDGNGDKGFENVGLTGHKIKLVKCNATHGGMGGAPIRVSSYIKNPIYQEAIETIERGTMRSIWTQAMAFLPSQQLHIPF